MATPTKAEAELLAKIQSLELQIAKQPKPREVTVKLSDACLLYTSPSPRD